jgi:hypothetical protein
MIKYISPINLNIDLDYIKKLVLNSLCVDTSDRKYSTLRFCCDDEYMASLHNKWYWMSNKYNILYTSNGIGFPIHVDIARLSALNIPIHGGEHSSTIFYESIGEMKTYTSPNERGYLLLSDTSEAYRFTLSEPTIINTQAIHSVDVADNSERIIISWGSNASYEETIELFNKQI